MVQCFPGWSVALSGFLCLQRPLASRDSFCLSSTESAGLFCLGLLKQQPRRVWHLWLHLCALHFCSVFADCLPDSAAQGMGGGGVIAALCLWPSKNFRGLNVVIVARYRCHQLPAVSSAVLFFLSRCNAALVSTFETFVCHMLVRCAVKRQSGSAEQSSCKRQQKQHSL